MEGATTLFAATGTRAAVSTGATMAPPSQPPPSCAAKKKTYLARAGGGRGSSHGCGGGPCVGGGRDAPSWTAVGWTGAGGGRHPPPRTTAVGWTGARGGPPPPPPHDGDVDGGRVDGGRDPPVEGVHDGQGGPLPPPCNPGWGGQARDPPGQRQQLYVAVCGGAPLDWGVGAGVEWCSRGWYGVRWAFAGPPPPFAPF